MKHQTDETEHKYDVLCDHNPSIDTEIVDLQFRYGHTIEEAINYLYKTEIEGVL